MYGLTTRQMKLYEFIKAQNALGISPTAREMQVAMDYKSVGSVIPMLRALKERGAVDYMPFRARTVKAK